MMESTRVRIAFLSWRDSGHPEGGGAEHYMEAIATRLVAEGHTVTIFCSRYSGSAARSSTAGVAFVRQGGRLSVYPLALLALRREESRCGRFDVVVDVQNGVPFFSRLARRGPVTVLVHHVHREQWRVVFGPVAARLGWFLESRIAPAVYRGVQYVTVSGRSRDELVELGVDPGAITVIHNGTDPAKAVDTPRATSPTLVVLGRLVPHKQVEHAVHVASRLRAEIPDLTLRIVGHGWWDDQIAREADRLRVADAVCFLGFVDDDTKHRELASAWVSLAPSVKEGWGLSVVEAASHGVPTVAYNGAGGLSESILNGRTGILVDDLDQMTAWTRRLLTDATERKRLGDGARHYATQFTWEQSNANWQDLLRRVAAGAGPADGIDDTPAPVSEHPPGR